MAALGILILALALAGCAGPARPMVRHVLAPTADPMVLTPAFGARPGGSAYHTGSRTRV